MNATNTLRTKILTRIHQALLPVVLLSLPLVAFSQVATIDLSAERDFVYQDGVYPAIGEAILPFVVVISNPGLDTINDLEFTVTIDSGAAVGNVDSQCLVGGESSTVLVCTLDELKANRTKTIDL